MQAELLVECGSEGCQRRVAGLGETCEVCLNELAAGPQDQQGSYSSKAVANTTEVAGAAGRSQGQDGTGGELRADARGAGQPEKGEEDE